MFPNYLTMVKQVSYSECNAKQSPRPLLSLSNFLSLVQINSMSLIILRPCHTIPTQATLLHHIFLKQIRNYSINITRQITHGNTFGFIISGFESIDQ